jgi:4-amino-4-deoxy-L-arabinose transferase-like glycosyltransferase
VSFDSAQDRRLLGPRERGIWLAGFVLVAIMIAATGFTSRDADSIRYATLSARLSELPVSRWVAPEWWGLTTTDHTGYFVEHPAGLFFIPAALGRLGIPAEQAPYIFGVAAGLAALLLTGHLIARLSSREEARAALVVLQFMPMAFVFRIRDNHEYPMLVCLLLVVLGLEQAGKRGSREAGKQELASWLPRFPASLLVIGGLVGAVLVKGVFVAVVLIAAAAWVLVNPLGGSRWRQIALCAAGLAATAVAAVVYDVWYARETGGPFWSAYLQRQLGPMHVASPLGQAGTFVQHVGFYLSRAAYHPAPWSLILLWAAVRRKLPPALDDRERRGFWFVLVFTASSMLLLSLASRVAERYTFSGNFLIGAAGAVVAYRYLPALRRWLTALDARVPALPAVVWTGLIVVRLAVGAFASP